MDCTRIFDLLNRWWWRSRKSNSVSRDPRIKQLDGPQLLSGINYYILAPQIEFIWDSLKKLRVIYNGTSFFNELSLKNKNISSSSQLIALVSEHWAFWCHYNTLGDRKGLIALFTGEKLRQKKHLWSCPRSPTGSPQQSLEWKPNPNTIARMLPHLSKQLTFEIPFRSGDTHMQLQVWTLGFKPTCSMKMSL